MKEFVLRTWKPEDAESLARAANNPHIARNLRNVFPNPYTLEDAIWFINDCLSNGGTLGNRASNDGISGEGKKQFNYAIEVDGKAAGGIGITVKEDVYEKSAELGYWLAKEHWRQGIMSRAVVKICKEAFETLDIVRIFAEPCADNAGSRGVLEKAGFTCEGTMRDGVYKNGEIHSYCMYSVLRGEMEI